MPVVGTLQRRRKGENPRFVVTNLPAEGFKGLSGSGIRYFPLRIPIIPLPSFRLAARTYG